MHKHGYHGWEAQYDESGKLIAITYIGADGKPALLADGYATVKSTYDARGKMNGQTYHGINGEAVLHQERYHGWKARYDERGNQIAMSYIGLDGKPTLLADGFAIIKSTFDARGNDDRTDLLRSHRRSGPTKNGYHGWEAKYDESGNPITITYIGLRRKLDFACQRLCDSEIDIRCTR